MTLGLCLPQLGPTAEGAPGRRGAAACRGGAAEFEAQLWGMYCEAAAEAGRAPEALRRETRVNTHAGEPLAATVEQVREAERRGADGVHVDFTYTAGSTAELLERAEELIVLLPQ